MKDKKQLLIAKNTVRDIFRDYKNNEDFIKQEVKQSLTSNHSNVVVQGGYSDGQALQRRIEDKSEREIYNESVEKILGELPSTYRKILINRYIRRKAHKEIIAKLDIDDNYYICEKTYYTWFNDSIMAFYNESIAKMVERKIKKLQ